MRYYQMTLNGEVLFCFYVKNHKKIDFGKLFTITQKHTNSWLDFEPHKLIMKEIKVPDDCEEFEFIKI